MLTTPSSPSHKRSPTDGSAESTLRAAGTAFKGKLGVFMYGAVFAFLFSAVFAAVDMNLSAMVALAGGGLATVVGVAGAVVRLRRERHRDGMALVDDLDGILDAFRDAAVLDMERLRNAISNELERFGRDSTETLRSLEARIGTVSTDLGSRLDAVDAREDRLAQEISELETALQSLTGDVGSRLDAVDARKDRLAQEISELETALQSLTGDLEQHISESTSAYSKGQTRVGTAYENAAAYQPFKRKADLQDLRMLAGEWSRNLGCRLEPNELAYWAHRVGAIEESCLGRLATSVESMLLRIMASRAALEHARESGDSLEILEIGTLFGIGLGLQYEACRDRGIPVHLTAIDPLDGYYGDGRADIVTGIAVTREVFEENLRRMHVPAENWSLHQQRSSEAFPQLAEQSRLFHFVLIDGDHSYSGVEKDAEGTLELLTPGGYLIIDDYNSDDWPDVTAYVDSQLLYRTDVQLIGDGFGTAVFRHV